MPPNDSSQDPDLSSAEAEQQQKSDQAEQAVEHGRAVPKADQAPTLGGGAPAKSGGGGGGKFMFARDEVIPVLKLWQQYYHELEQLQGKYQTMGQVRPLAPDEFSVMHAQASKEFATRETNRYDAIKKYAGGWIAKMYATAQSYNLVDELSASDLAKIKQTLQYEGIAVPGDKA